MTRIRSVLEWAAIITGFALAYPFVKSGGSLDQAIGPWWLLTLPALVLLLVCVLEPWRMFADDR